MTERPLHCLQPNKTSAATDLRLIGVHGSPPRLQRNEVLVKARRGESTLGFGVHHLRTSAAGIMAAATGHDWLFIDAELATFSVSEIAQMSIAAMLAGIPPIVRVRPDDLGSAARALDNGACGVVVAHVESAAQARKIVNTLRFAPLGERSWGGANPRLGFAQGVGPDCGPMLDAETAVFAMVESAMAVEAAAEIAAVDGIDGLFIGAQDLSLSLGVPTAYSSIAFLTAVDKTLAACHSTGKVSGIGGVYDATRLALLKPARFGLILTGNDHAYVRSGAAQRSDAIRKAITYVEEQEGTL